MTRRERHLRILESFGMDRVRGGLRSISTDRLIALLSDEGIEQLTRTIVSDHRRQQRYNREAREIARRKA